MWRFGMLGGIFGDLGDGVGFVWFDEGGRG